MITFRYKLANGVEHVGTVMQIVVGNPLELEIEADGRMFHTIVGKHQNGNYICIPNWDEGCELSSLRDEFWNAERLRNHTPLHEDNVTAIVRAISEMDKWMQQSYIMGGNKCET